MTPTPDEIREAFDTLDEFCDLAYCLRKWDDARTFGGRDRQLAGIQ